MTMGTVYIVATPIGNLGDISPRAARTLEAVDFIAAEDTRVTVKLLNHLGIQKPMISCHEHNERDKSEYIIQRVLSGEDCALVSDAGTPGISDPGGRVAALCRARGVKTVIIPGPAAAICAVALSGLGDGRFCFEGFLPSKGGERRAHLKALAGEQRLMIFYEAPHRLAACLADMMDAFGERSLCLCRELTKLHEEVVHTTLSAAVALYGEKSPRGEYVLAVEGAKATLPEPATLEEGVRRVQELMAQGLSASAAAKQAAAQTGLTKSVLYKAVCEAKE